MKKGVITTVSFILFVAVFAVGTFFGPKREFSESENRVLKGFPELSLDTIASGEAQAGLVTFASDQLFLRDFFVSLKTSAEKLSGNGDIGGVYLCDDGYYITKTTENDVDDEIFHANISAVNTLFNKGKQLGIENMSFILAPTAGGVMTDKLPAWAEVFHQKSRIDTARESLTAGKFIDLYDDFAKSPDSLFYKTDHHWTSRGAYLAYTKYCQAFGAEPKEYTATVASENFRGTLYSKAPYFGAPYDTVELYNIKKESGLSLEAGGKEQAFAVYDKEKLETKDKYKVFFGDNYPLMTITSDSGNGHLLLIKDSFANCFLPFIAEDYETVTVIDPRYYTGSTLELIEGKGITDIMVLYNIESFVSDNTVLRITV